MKGVMKLFWVAAAFAAVFGFVGCENPSGSTNNNSGAAGKAAVAQYGYEQTEKNDSSFIDLIFMSDGTWTLEFYGKSGSKELRADKYEGTYTGDPTKDGTVETAITKVRAPASEEDRKKMNAPDKWDEIKFEEQDFSDAPVKREFVISGGGKKTSFMGVPLTRR